MNNKEAKHSNIKGHKGLKSP